MSANISNNLSGFSCSIAVFVKLVWSNELRHCVHDFLLKNKAVFETAWM